MVFMYMCMRVHCKREMDIPAGFLLQLADANDLYATNLHPTVHCYPKEK